MRYYDLLGRLLPASALAHELPLRERLRRELLSRYRAHGQLGIGGAGDILRRDRPREARARWPEHPGRNALREDLFERGALVLVEVEGVSGKRVASARTRAPGNPARADILRRVPSPFDPLVWDRELHSPV